MSATNSFVPSEDTPYGAYKVSAPMPPLLAVLDVILGWPTTTSAEALSAVGIELYMRTRLLDVSARNIFPSAPTYIDPPLPCVDAKFNVLAPTEPP